MVLQNPTMEILGLKLKIPRKVVGTLYYTVPEASMGIVFGTQYLCIWGLGLARGDVEGN